MRINEIVRRLALAGCFISTSSAWAAEAPKDASAATQQANNALFNQLPFSDNTDFTNAHKGFIAPLPQEIIKGEQGNTVWILSSTLLSKKAIRRPTRLTRAYGVSPS